MNNFLATYRDDKYWSFLWLQDEEEVQEWLDENKDTYNDIEVIEITVVKTIYESK